jgi:DNA mismatch repair protein MLH3
MSICPLPDGVAAQIKSSTTIVSLTGVVLELLKNSLDAKASRVTVTADFARGSCTVEDDGLGIPPAEFSEQGGLGKLYCMYRAHFSCNGRVLTVKGPPSTIHTNLTLVNMAPFSPLSQLCRS